MRFRLLGIPVEVSSSFWIIAVVLGLFQGSIPLFLATLVLVFLAVLTHEMGHALTARAFGAEPSILLHRFGGTTTFRYGVLSRGKSIAVTFAGPLTGIALGLALLVLGHQLPPASETLQRVLDNAVFCTLGWSLLNLLPVLPLDGGLIVRDVLGPSRGRATLILSAVCGAALTVAFLSWQQVFPAVIFGLATFRSASDAWRFRDLVDARRQELVQVLRALEGAETAVQRGFLASAESTASEILAGVPIPALRDRARRILASVEIHREQAPRALEILEGLEMPTAADDVLRAQSLDVAGRQEDAFALLRSRLGSDPSGAVLTALLQGLAAVGRQDEIDALLRDHPHLSDPVRGSV